MLRKRMNEVFFYDPYSLFTDTWKRNPYNLNEWYKLSKDNTGLMNVKITRDPVGNLIREYQSRFVGQIEYCLKHF